MKFKRPLYNLKDLVKIVLLKKPEAIVGLFFFIVFVVLIKYIIYNQKKYNKGKSIGKYLYPGLKIGIVIPAFNKEKKSIFFLNLLFYT